MGSAIGRAVLPIFRLPCTRHPTRSWLYASQKLGLIGEPDISIDHRLYQFSADDSTYWKTPETIHLDEEYGDIDTNIQG